MGKPFELLGLVSFNIFIALILSIVFLKETPPAATYSALTEANVAAFITEMSDISSGKREEMDAYSKTSFFMTHIAENSIFRTLMRYNLPDMPTKERTMEMDRLNFISHMIHDEKKMTDHETRTDIEHIAVKPGGKAAEVMTTSYERGIMPVADGMGEERLMPVTGASYCTQALILDQNIIKVAAATCTTDISFETGF